MSSQVRNILVVVLVAVIAIPAAPVLWATASNFVVGEWRINVTVANPITCEPSLDGETAPAEVTLLPGDSLTQEFECFNDSDANLDAMFTARVDPEDAGVTVEVPDFFVIPGKRSTRQTVIIRAARDVPLSKIAVFRVVLQLEAGEYP